MRQIRLPQDPLELARKYHGFAYMANEYVSGDLWTTVATDSGTVTLDDNTPPRISLAPSDGTVADNDEIYVHTTAEMFKFADDKPLILEAEIQFAEANTDDANVLLGFMDAVAANALVDNGGGPKASYSGAVFFKVDGGTTWQAEFSDSTTQDTTDLTAANSLDGVAQTAGGSASQILRLEFRPTTTTKADLLYWIDGILVEKKTDQTFANATDMHVVLGAKNGDTNNEDIKMHYCCAYQLK